MGVYFALGISTIRIIAGFSLQLVQERRQWSRNIKGNYPSDVNKQWKLFPTNKSLEYSSIHKTCLETSVEVI